MTGFNMATWSDPMMIVAGTFLLHQTVFWIYNGLIVLFTYVLYPTDSKKYKIQKVRHIREWTERESLTSFHSRMFTWTGNPFASVRKQSWSIKWSFCFLFLYWFAQYSCISTFVGIYLFLPGNYTFYWLTPFSSVVNGSLYFRYQILFELIAFLGITEIFFYYSHLTLVGIENSCCFSSTSQ